MSNKLFDRLIEIGVMFVFMATFLFVGSWILAHLPGPIAISCDIHTGPKPGSQE